MNHRRAGSSFKKRKGLSLKKEKLFQSSGAWRTWCHACISKTDISVWIREFQSLSDQTMMWGLGQEMEEMSSSPQRQWHEFLRIYLTSFTQSLA